MRRSFYLPLIVLLCFALPGIAQESAFVPPLKQMVDIPASPEAAAFAKYGSTPVSQYNGTPNISVPLAQVAGRSASLPLTLTYDASGIKVEQTASWVGLGWNLNVGGAVTRRVNGLPDDYLDANPKYYPYYSTEKPSWNSTYGMDHFVDYYKSADLLTPPHEEYLIDNYKDFLDDFNNSIVDTQPDSYSFSALGISGTLYIDYSDGSAVCLEHPEYIVEPTLAAAESDENGSRLLTKWVITDNQGNQYTFDKVETTELLDYDNDPQEDEFRDYYSAWYLTEFKSTNGKDVFTFNFQPNITTTNSEQQLAGTESMALGGSVVSTYAPKIKILQYEPSNVFINGKRRVDFTWTGRNDLPGKNALDKIKILDRDGNSLNEIDLITSYFNDGSTAPHDEYEQRLKLDSVKILGASSAAAGDAQLTKAYGFSYFGTDFVPSRLHLGQDFWGYYNGWTLNTHLRPHVQSSTSYDGANRVPNTTNALKGTLQKIGYPTGGTTEFFYQQNYRPSVPAGSANVATGGFRVYKIVDRPDANSIAQTRYFYYGELDKDDLDDLDDDFFKTSDATSGILQVPKDFLVRFPSKTYDGTQWVDAESITVLATTRSKARNSIVTYSTVTELQFSGGETNGFTVYKFNNISDVSTSLSTTAAPLNGRLKNSLVYDNTLNLIQQKSLTYDNINIKGLQGYKLESTIYQDYNGIKKDYLSDNTKKYIAYETMTTSSSVPYVTACSSCLLPGSTNKYAPTTYYFQQRWTRLLSETSTSYEASGELTTTTSYNYDAWDPFNPDDTHFEVVSTETKDDDQVVYTGFTYPQDMTGTIYEHMVDANRTGQVVKTITKRGGANGLTLQEQETTFTGSSTSQLPDLVKYGTNGGALETRIDYGPHDAFKNPLSLVKDNYQNIQYLWDYNGALPSAMVTGVLDNTSTRKFAYTSFESTEKGYWTYTGATAAATSNPSGKKTYNLNGGAVTRSTLDTDETYILAFWAKGTGTVKIDQKLSGVATTIEQAVTTAWKYYQVEVKSLDELVLAEKNGGDSIELDELRLYANGSQMTTYAYDGAGRLITQLGPNGIPIHYEYDLHGRLLKVKDHEGNTLRLMEYEYQRTTN